MVQVTPCPNAAILQRLLVGQTADEESVSLEAHLLHCEQCLRAIQSLPADDALISALQSGREFATPMPASGLLEKLRLCLQEMTPSSQDGDTATRDVTAPDAPTPSHEMMMGDHVHLAPPQQPDEIGRLGGYRVLKELGRGGMGMVYQAEDLKLKRLVALKVMLPRVAADANARRRFLREAQAMAAVHHDHVVTIYQVDEDNGVPFLAMEFLHGMPLDQWLQGGRKPALAQILRMGREIAEGLAAAHARGLIHRDIKPGNIWLDSEHKGRVKILDFGLVRVGTEDVHLTRSGAILGTPAYMSPEQACGEEVDARTDLFSLGSILYRFCTGAMPFRGDTTMALLTNLAISDPKPVRELNPETPPALADLVMRLLAKKPDDRPASAQEVVDQLAALEQGGRAAGFTPAGTTQTEIVAPAGINPAARPAKPRSRRGVALVLLGSAAALILAAVGAVVYVQTDRGTLEIKTDDPDVKVTVEQNGDQVDVLDPQSKQQLSIHSGQYTLKLTGVDGADHEMVIDQGKNPVTLTRGGKVVVTVSRTDKPGLMAKATETAKSDFPPLDEAWVKKVHDLPPEKQVEEVAAELKRRNPGFDGKLKTGIFNGAVLNLALLTDEVRDLSPVGALSEVHELTCGESFKGRSRLADLTPLKGMKLTLLECTAPGVSDLSPLNGMPLAWLHLGRTQVFDLPPLKGMPLTTLNLGETKVSDLSPLRGMKLMELDCSNTAVSDLSPLEGMKLVQLNFRNTRISNLAPLKDMPLTALGMDNTLVSDLLPLQGMSLKTFGAENTPISDLSPLRGMPLTLINIGRGPKVADLSPLAGMKLTDLTIVNCPVSDLSPLRGAPLTGLLAANGTAIYDLSPLKDSKLNGLGIANTPVSDLSPLKDLPLTVLDARGTKVTDLSSLKKMPLKELWCDFNPERDAEILHSIKTLEQINGKPAAEFWKDPTAHAAFRPLDEAWVKKVRDLPAVRQVEEVVAELKRRNPGYDGNVKTTIELAVVTGLAITSDDLADLAPLTALPQLAVLSVAGIDPAKNRLTDLTPIRGMTKLTYPSFANTAVADLSPLRGMPLTALNCGHTVVSDLSPLSETKLTSLVCPGTRVADLGPLHDLKLTHLDVNTTRVADLTPLKGMPLKVLECGNTQVIDLAPLEGMKLESVACYGTRVADLTPLKGMPLTYLRVESTPVADLAPLKGMKIVELTFGRTRVTDLSPLREMPLRAVSGDFTGRDADLLRSIPTLEKINNKPAAEFWKEVDAKAPEKKR